MKQAKLIFMIWGMMLICCSYSIGQASSGIGVKGTISNGVPVILGTINNGVSVYPSGGVSNGATVNLGRIKTGANVPMLREFVCNSMSACGMYDPGRVSNGAIVNLGGVRSGATVSGIDGSAMRMVSLANAKN